jgi:hypothetical protein
LSCKDNTTMKSLFKTAPVVTGLTIAIQVSD